PGTNRPGLARRLIFITGDTVSPDTRAFLGDVTVPVLTKPFRVGLLRETINEVLAAGEHRALRETHVDKLARTGRSTTNIGCKTGWRVASPASRGEKASWGAAFKLCVPTR